MLGTNYAAGFPNPDGTKAADRGGSGSDFDGAQLPLSLGDAAVIVSFRVALTPNGYDATLLTKLCHENRIALRNRQG
ncbi:MAG: hypothetical protein WBB25_20490 [Sulfitobacter sp.]